MMLESSFVLMNKVFSGCGDGAVCLSAASTQTETTSKLFGWITVKYSTDNQGSKMSCNDFAPPLTFFRNVFEADICGFEGNVLTTIK